MTLLVIHRDGDALSHLGQSLHVGHCHVLTAPRGEDALALVRRDHVDLVVIESARHDLSAMAFMRHLQRNGVDIPILVVPNQSGDADSADRLGWNIANLLKSRAPHPVSAGDDRAHAVARWANAVVPLIDAYSDPKTLARWSQCIFVSPGALRNWCRTAALSPRRSLVFARLLRAVARMRHDEGRLENLLDVVDRRTLAGLLRLAGFSRSEELPSDVETFLERQDLIQDAAALRELRRSLGMRGYGGLLRGAVPDASSRPV